MSRNWVAVASAEHVRIGRSHGFMQVCHGKAAPYQADMGGGFSPFRRDVSWCAAREAPIKPLVGRLEFTTAKRNWGFQLRFGLFEISEHDMKMIAAAMGASPEWRPGDVGPDAIPPVEAPRASFSRSARPAE
jgi:hypothetical protein